MKIVTGLEMKIKFRKIEGSDDIILVQAFKLQGARQDMRRIFMELRKGLVDFLE